MPIENGANPMNYYRQGPFRTSGAQIGVPRMTPWVKRIMISCAAVWVVQWLDAMLLGLGVTRWLGLVPQDVARGLVWQPFTYMFLHEVGSPFHLVFNMLVLWMFGSDLEQTWGGKPFVTYYLVCGIGAGLLSVVAGLAFGSRTLTTGASGAIFGLIVAFGMVFAERTVLFMMIFPMKARTLALILAGLALFSLGSSTGGNVAHVAHFGGALTGFLYLKRAWRVGALYRELRWRVQRRRFRVMPPDDPDDRWLN